MKRLIFAAVSAALITSAAAANAAEQKGQFSISPVAGGYTFDGKQHLKTAPVYGIRTGYNLTQDFGVEALFDYARTKGTINKENTTMYRGGADLILNLMPENKLVPFLALGVSGISVDGTGQDKKIRAAWDYGAGLKYYLADGIALRGDVRHIIYNRSAATINNLEYVIGVHIPFGAEKLPSTAVADNQTPPVAKTPVPVAVIPPTPLPIPIPIPPAIDPPKRTVIPVLNKSVDSDKDGIKDSLDKCPNTALGTIVDINGCPQSDTTAKRAEIAQRFCDKPVVLTVSFDSGRAEIKSAFHEELARVADFLKEFPASKGTIEGHTDNVGNVAANTRLSQRRAENVRAYLINNFGIDPARISAKGFGPDKPVASNKTATGKAKNRRIEAIFNCE